MSEFGSFEKLEDRVLLSADGIETVYMPLPELQQGGPHIIVLDSDTESDFTVKAYEGDILRVVITGVLNDSYVELSVNGVTVGRDMPDPAMDLALQRAAEFDVPVYNMDSGVNLFGVQEAYGLGPVNAEDVSNSEFHVVFNDGARFIPNPFDMAQQLTDSEVDALGIQAVGADVFLMPPPPETGHIVEQATNQPSPSTVDEDVDADSVEDTIVEPEADSVKEDQAAGEEFFCIALPSSVVKAAKDTSSETEAAPVEGDVPQENTKQAQPANTEQAQEAEHSISDSGEKTPADTENPEQLIIRNAENTAQAAENLPKTDNADSKNGSSGVLTANASKDGENDISTEILPVESKFSLPQNGSTQNVAAPLSASNTGQQNGRRGLLYGIVTVSIAAKALLSNNLGRKVLRAVRPEDD